MEGMHEPRGIHRRIRFEVTPALRERLMARVAVAGPNDCWYWKGADRNGYGAIKHEGRTLGTHVVAFLAAGGVIGEGEIVLHSCDNRLCCNPAHLSSNTIAENNRQCFDRRCVNTLQGTKSPLAKLNDDLVRQIWAMRLLNGWGQVRIARAIGHSVHTVKHIIRGDGWKHIAKPTDDEARAILAAMNIEVRRIKPSGKRRTPVAKAPKRTGLPKWALELLTK